MAAGLRFLRSLSLVVAAAASVSPAFSQAGRSWVDPPTDLTAPPPPAPQASPAPVEPPPPPAAQQDAPPPPQVSPGQAARPDSGPAVVAKEPHRSDRTEAARNLTIRYLQSWSAATEDNLEANAEFYGPRVLFHGRLVSLRNLMREKRRFIRRWPERRYAAQPDTVQVACEAQGNDCAVQSIFDFTAAHPKRGRRTQGTGALQLIVSFVDNQPLISAESSMVLDQGPDDQIMTPEDSDDE
ncbi:hypothetical protein [Microvirga rosea]|uniref:hypothetical protein n=1 Tax=Microvirga rosea TaxID=2715425 RepID=UPI001D09AA66|nr:hypothetical protein [Microvirga rosea]MCB8819526.1 hypothetical protein [Microvirga rosea]